MYQPSLKFVALPIPQIIGVLNKFRQSLESGYAHAPFSPKILMGFCSDGTTADGVVGDVEVVPVAAAGNAVHPIAGRLRRLHRGAAAERQLCTPTL